MDAADYQYLASRTLVPSIDPPLSKNETMALWNLTGLTGESGEVAEMLKKVIFHRHELDKEKLTKELGDVLWYLSMLALQYDIPLTTIMEKNIEKLRARYPEGFKLANTHHEG